MIQQVISIMGVIQAMLYEVLTVSQLAEAGLSSQHMASLFIYF